MQISLPMPVMQHILEQSHYKFDEAKIFHLKFCMNHSAFKSKHPVGSMISNWMEAKKKWCLEKSEWFQFETAEGKNLKAKNDSSEQLRLGLILHGLLTLARKEIEPSILIHFF